MRFFENRNHPHERTAKMDYPNAPRDSLLGTVSAIVVDYYTRGNTLDLVRDLSGESDVVDILIVDNTGDAAYQAGWPREFGPNTRVIANPRRAGYGEGVNLGVQNTVDTSHILFLNSDLRLPEGTVHGLLECLVELEYAAVGPLVLDSDGWPQLDAFGKFPDLDTQSGPLDWITGACVLVRRDAFEHVGGFDEGYFMYWEDVDFCRRLYVLGLRAGIADSVNVIHKSGGSDSSVASRYKRARMSRNRYYEKWSPHSFRGYGLRGSSKVKLIWLKLFCG